MSHKTKILRERERVKRWFLTLCNNPSKSFTLVELLIVIGILAALAAAVVVVINPVEMLRQGRDSTRMREIGAIHRALSMFQVDRSTAPLGSSNIIHISIPDTSPTCANLTLPTPPSGWAYRCVPAAYLRRIDGTGWIPIDFTSVFQGSPLPSLPIDPTNTTASSNFYVYITDGRTWVLASLLESERHAPSASRDGGTDAARFEAGTNLALWTTASGLVGYWSFDGTGSIANNQDVGLRDTSGRDNHGTASNANATGMVFVPGRVGNAVSFDGVDDFVEIGDRPTLNFHGTQPFTIEAWVRPAVANHAGVIVGRFNGGVAGNYHFGFTGGRLYLHREVSPFTKVRTTVLTVNIWHHVVGTYDGSHMRLFINGSSDAVPVASGSVPNVSIRVLIGARLQNNVPAFFFNGLIHEVRIHNRVLTEAEIRAIFNATR